MLAARSGTWVSSASLDDLSSPLLGDCNDDGGVTVDGLITMVNMSLGAAPATTCATADLDGSGTISVEESSGR